MGFFNGLLQSFFSPQIYSAVRQEKGIGGKFIFALSVITLLFLALEFGGGSAGFMATVKSLPDIVRSFPAMTMKDEKLSIDKPVPYDIKLANTGLRIVVDTSYKTTDLGSLKEKMQDRNIVMMVTQDAFIGLEKSGDLKVQDFKSMQDMQDFTASHEDWEGLAQWLESVGIPLIVAGFVALLILSILTYNLIATFFSGVVVTIIGAVLRASLEFDAAMRLAAMARFPAGVISLLPFIRPGVGWLIWAAYLIFAVVACRPPKTTLPAV